MELEGIFRLEGDVGVRIYLLKILNVFVICEYFWIQS